MIERPEVLALAEALESWSVANSRWRPIAGEGILCRECEYSPFVEASGLRGFAPHSVLHALCSSLERATDDVARELWLQCGRCVELDEPQCAHALHARVLVLDQLAESRVDLADATEQLHRQTHEWERRYAVRRLDELFERSRAWMPSESMLAPQDCVMCSTHLLRGEAHVRRLPHDLRHELYTLIDDVADEFADTAVWGRNTAGECPRPGALTWARSLMTGLVVDSAPGFRAFLETVIDTARAQWIVDHCPMTVADIAREEALAMARPEWEASLQERLGELVGFAQLDLSPTRSSEIGRSPYALVACPDLHWPAWLLDGIVSMAFDLRQVFCSRAAAGTVVAFDAWLFERLRSLPLFENRVALAMGARHGDQHRRSMGLRLLAPVDDSIIDDLRADREATC